MRNKLFLSFFAVAVFSVCSIYAQIVPVDQVPKQTIDKLNNLFPGATDISWTKSDNSYKAQLSYNDTKVLCTIGETGKWIESETEYEFNTLPRSSQKNFSTTMSSCKVKKCILKDTPNSSEYNVFVVDTAASVDYIVVYSKAGDFVSKLDSKGVDVNTVMEKRSEGSMQVIHPKELPSSISSFIISSYSDYVIKECYFINDDKHKNTYYVIIQNPTFLQNIKLWFDFQGKLYETDDPNLLSKSNSDNDNVKEDVEKKDKEKDKERRKESRREENAGFPESKVPALAIQNFQKKEPKAEDVKWDTTGRMFVASYHNPQRDFDCKMYFAENGTWKSTHTLLDQRNLHPQIMNHLDKNIGNLRIYSAVSVVNADKTKYTLVKTYDPRWANDPMVYNELYFSTSGRLDHEDLADFIDPDEEYRRKAGEEQENAFIDYVDSEAGDASGDSDGQIIPQRELPGNINKCLAEKYRGFFFKEAMLMNDDGNYVYSIFVKKEGANVKKRLIFDIKGNFVSEEDF